MEKKDVLVLGAGIVGIATALQLQRLGCSVVLADKGEPGAATSFGNAGIIERASLYPYAFPRDWRVLLRYALNNNTDVHFRWGSVLRHAGALFQYWRNSAPGRLHASMLALRPLIERCVQTHQELAQAANASSLLHDQGWIEIARCAASWANIQADADHALSYGIQAIRHDNAALHALVPALQGDFCGGIHYRDAVCVRDPIDLSRAYVRLFQAGEGQVIRADAQQLQHQAGHWYLPYGPSLAVQAHHVVFCLGPWSAPVLARWGYTAPFFVKRGYHQEYSLHHAQPLSLPLLDVDGGYVLAPMQGGVRLTTGAQFMERDDPPYPIQVVRAERVARTVLPLGSALKPEPWMGSRPCLPDMRPIIGPLPGVERAWVNCAHQHHGLTLGPITGLLLAQMLQGQTPSVNLQPFSPKRFGA